MSKAFVKENDAAEDGDGETAVPLPQGAKNYITPAGYVRLKSEAMHLLDVERPQVVRTVTWAASNGDRSENADYIYGKRRLREIDRRIRFLTKRLDLAEVVDPATRGECDQVFFGATVTYCDSKGEEHTISIVGVDEIDTARGRVSWVAPVARALLKAREGDMVMLKTPAGVEELEVLEIRYVPLD
ncbi:MAG: transcription elongation factor GreB [Pseudomonadota bacterium]